MSKGIFDFEWLTDFFWLLHLHSSEIWVLTRSRVVSDKWLQSKVFFKRTENMTTRLCWIRVNTKLHISWFKFSFWISIDFSVWRVFRWSDGEFAICVKWSMLALVLIQWVEVQCELEFQFPYAIPRWSFFVALSTSKRTKIVLYLEKLLW